VHTVIVEVSGSLQFQQWIDEIIAGAKKGDPIARKIAKYLNDELTYLKSLDEKPTEENATLRKVVQSGKNQIWRVSHPYDKEVAVRIIVWFDDENDEAVITLFGANKLPIGDVFYASAGTRADQIIHLLKLKRRNEERDNGR